MKLKQSMTKSFRCSPYVSFSRKFKSSQDGKDRSDYNLVFVNISCWDPVMAVSQE